MIGKVNKSFIAMLIKTAYFTVFRKSNKGEELFWRDRPRSPDAE